MLGPLPLLIFNDDLLDEINSTALFYANDAKIRSVKYERIHLNLKRTLR